MTARPVTALALLVVCALLLVPCVGMALTVGLLTAAASQTAGALGISGPGPGRGGSPTSCRAGGSPTIRTASIRDLCHGLSDAARLARTIAAIRPDSPLVDRAEAIVRAGHRSGVDPLLIVQWQGESGMATVVPPVSANGPDNGGNLTWAAAEPYAAAWGCTPGATVVYPDGSYLFARCPSIEAGIGLWFAYVAGRYPAATHPDLAAYAETYNSCAYPGNEANGFLCGAAYAGHILDLLDRHAGVPTDGGGTGFNAITGGRPMPISQEFGRTAFSESPEGRATYAYGTCFGLDGASHPGVDVGTEVGTPLHSPVVGTVEVAGGVGPGEDGPRFTDESGADWRTAGQLRIRLDNGDILILGHLRLVTVAVGQRVAPGTPVGQSGTSNGPHVHVEYRRIDPALPCGYRTIDPRPALG